MVLGLGRRRRAAAGRREDRKKNWLRPNTGDAKKRFSKKVAPADPKKTPMVVRRSLAPSSSPSPAKGRVEGSCNSSTFVPTFAKFQENSQIS